MRLLRGIAITVGGLLIGLAFGIWLIIPGIILAPFLIGIPLIIAGLAVIFGAPFMLAAKLDEAKRVRHGRLP